MAMALRSLAVKPSGGASLLSLLSRRHFTAGGPLHSLLPRLFPLVAVSELRKLVPLALRGFDSVRCFSVNRTSSSLNDPSPNWSNRPPKETILLDGCDFEHWLVVVEPPDPSLTRDEIIQVYIKTLAQVIGSEEEARFKIYSVSTKHYFAFGALVSEEVSYKIKELPGVRWVLPDSYLDVKNKDYGGEPFINGEAVPYDPKYHEEWVRNNARAMERNRRNDRNRNIDRPRNFERRRENMQNFQNRPPPPPPMQNQGPGQWNQGPPNPVNVPGQGPVPLHTPVQNLQNTIPPPGPGLNPQNAMAGNLPNAGGPSYGGYPNQMPGNSIQPPMPGQNTQPGMPHRTFPNPGPPNQNYGGFQNHVPSYQNGPPPGNQDYSAGGIPYQGGNSSHPPRNAYQGGPANYQGGPQRYQGPQNPYQGGTGSYQAPPTTYQSNAGNGSIYQGQDPPARNSQ